jgi:tetratricopeptide (TPR) repeat protein
LDNAIGEYTVMEMIGGFDFLPMPDNRQDLKKIINLKDEIDSLRKELMSLQDQPLIYLEKNLLELQDELDEAEPDVEIEVEIAIVGPHELGTSHFDTLESKQVLTIFGHETLSQFSCPLPGKTNAFDWFSTEILSQLPKEFHVARLSIAEGISHEISMMTSFIFHEQGQSEMAFDTIHTSLSNNPDCDNPKVWMCYGQMAGATNNHEIVVEAYEKVLELADEDEVETLGEASNNLGVAYQHLKQMPEAIQAFRNAISLDLDHANRNYNLGQALALTGQHDEALIVLAKAKSLDASILKQIQNDPDLDSMRHLPEFQKLCKGK